MSFVNHPDFPTLKPWIQIQVYGRDGGPKKPRRRIELMNSTPRHIVLMALKLTMKCSACGREMHPFRFRKAALRGGDLPKHIYFAAACPELPSEGDVNRWKTMATDPGATVQVLQSALIEAADSYRTCCKGSAPSKEYEAVVAAIEGT
jgi:hypothetical protein